MKPRLTIDDRGAVLHVDTDDRGNGIAIPLEPNTVLELAAGFERAKATLKTPAGRSTFLRGLGRLLLELTEPKEVTTDGTSKPKR